MRLSRDLKKLKNEFMFKLKYRGFLYAVFASFERLRDVVGSRTGVNFWIPWSCAGEDNTGLDWVHAPVGINELVELQEAVRPMSLRIKKDAPPTINVLLPTLEPKLVFGGYIAMLHFIRVLRQRGYNIRVIICDYYPLESVQKRLRQDAANHALISSCLGDTPIEFGRTEKGGVTVGVRDSFLSYSWVTSHLAHWAAQQVNGRPFTFFIQEFEPIFYPNGSPRALAESTYALPHNAIFNSHLLAEFFKQSHLGIYEKSPENPEREAIFSHSICKVRTPEVDELKERPTKKVLFYARPEAHASRNLFSIGMMGLRAAVMEGVFGPEWEFFGIGSMSFDQKLDLGNGRLLNVVPRMSLEKYQDSLSDYDLGIALMHAPHPSVPPLEMAAAGMPTITTVYRNRPVEVMQKLSPNLIPVRPYPGEIAAALAKAKDMVDDVEARVAGADFEWPTNWDDSFNDEFMAKVEGFFLE